MTIPQWVIGPKSERHDETARASRMLRYVLNRAALKLLQNPSMGKLAQHCDIPSRYIYRSIDLGRFSPKLAQEIEKKCGRDLIRSEWLVFPLNINNDDLA